MERPAGLPMENAWLSLCPIEGNADIYVLQIVPGNYDV